MPAIGILNSRKGEQLTKEQSIILTGFSGMLCCPFADFHEDVEKRLGYPVFTLQFGSEDLMSKIKEIYRKDFSELCYKGETQ